MDFGRMFISGACKTLSGPGFSTVRPGRSGRASSRRKLDVGAAHPRKGFLPSTVEPTTVSSSPRTRSFIRLRDAFPALRTSRSF